MKLHSLIKNAVRNLQSSKLRSFLAMLSIMVGTASIVALISAGQLATAEALKQFKTLGTNLMSVALSPADMNSQTNQHIDSAKIISMPSSIPDILEIAPYADIYLTSYYQEKSWSGTTIASTYPLASVMNIRMQQGRFLSPMDKDKNFCVVGQNVLQQLKKQMPIGERIKLGTYVFTIIGVASHWTENNFFPEVIDNAIIVPIEMTTLLSQYAQISNIVMKINKTADLDAVKQAITNYFDVHIPGYVLTFQSAKELILSMSTQQRIFTLLLGLIGGIALLVGGIGVMNIMLASVSERRNEIGLRLALGAEPGTIQLMFIMEAIVLALTGGGVGVVIGILSTIFIANIAGWTYTLFFTPPIIGLGSSILICLFFGFYPAYKASKLNPIEALKGI